MRMRCGRFYSAIMPRLHFMFALWSAVDGVRYGRMGDIVHQRAAHRRQEFIRA